MADDILTRLRSFADMLKGGYAKKLAIAAIDEIKRLDAEIMRRDSIIIELRAEIQRLEQVSRD